MNIRRQWIIKIWPSVHLVYKIVQFGLGHSNGSQVFKVPGKLKFNENHVIYKGEHESLKNGPIFSIYPISCWILRQKIRLNLLNNLNLNTKIKLYLLFKKLKSSGKTFKEGLNNWHQDKQVNQVNLQWCHSQLG